MLPGSLGTIFRQLTIRPSITVQFASTYP